MTRHVLGEGGCHRSRKEKPGFQFYTASEKELNVFGSRNALKKDFVELIDLVKEGKVPVKGIITNIYKFEDGAKAFDDFANNPGKYAEGNPGLYRQIRHKR